MNTKNSFQCVLQTLTTYISNSGGFRKFFKMLIKKLKLYKIEVKKNLNISISQNIYANTKVLYLPSTKNFELVSLSM